MAIRRNVVKQVRNRLPQLKVSFSKLSTKEVLVGVPSEDAKREKGPDDKSPMNNAAIAYIQDNGSPAAHIPARPFMKPGISAVKGPIISRMKNAARMAVDLRPGADPKIESTLSAVGLIAQASIRRTITEGIPPPLAPSTIAQRFRQRGTKTRRKGEEKYLDLVAGGMEGGEAQAVAGITPLINTGQLRNSINYVIRNRGKR